AAKAGIWGNWNDFYQANVVATQNIIEGCRKCHVGKLVFTSSPSVIFDNQPHTGCNESHPYPKQYESFYPQTKAMAERMVVEANENDLLTVSLRPHLIWGPRDAHILPGIIDRARDGKLIQVGKGTNLVDMVYVEDAARAHLLAADALQPGTAVAGSCYFITQDEPVNLWEWISALLKHLDIQPPQRSISLRTARTIGRIMEMAFRWLPLQGEPRMTRFLASELAMSHYYDISRAKKDFGYTPQWSMSSALEKTLPWLRRPMA
ncbi:MAG: NAD-dependent epimerase/dehydratase family protein, partial [Candidatus Hydrogenedentes bacterium]|nr:NAD-dependent epimerase/dehydratase family protein [Candidatus Hydrogenedentota bacterium]